MNNLGARRGAWTEEEDRLLKDYIGNYGVGKWHRVPTQSGLNRCRKSCRLRWLNYLRPGIKRGAFGEDEVDLIFRLHRLLGNRWSLIAGRLPGRTANDVKNYWNTHLRKKLQHFTHNTLCNGSCNKDRLMKKPNKVEIVKPRASSLSETRIASLRKMLSDNCEEEKADKGNDATEANRYSSGSLFELSENAASISSWKGCSIQENTAGSMEVHMPNDNVPAVATIMESNEEDVVLNCYLTQEFWSDLELWDLSA